jgi:hypothetical protein
MNNVIFGGGRAYRPAGLLTATHTHTKKKEPKENVVSREINKYREHCGVE